VPPRVPQEKWDKFDALHGPGGLSVQAAARQAGISYKTAALHAKGLKKADGQPYHRHIQDQNLPKPKAADDSKLKDAAKRALEDFEFFRLRYFGHVSTPWQTDAAEQMVKLLESPDKEHVVVNVPPGAGKSTTFTHDIIAWMIVRNRGVRVLIGSRTERQARQYVGRLKTTFERTQPPTASDELKRKGLAQDAVATLTGDFGRFKPTNPDVWRSEEFTVAQVNDIAGSDKERTVSAFGMDGGFLGGRYDVVVWDDLVDRKSLRTAEARETLINMWESEAETRLEPGGLLILQGQRIAQDDLYAYALDMRSGEADDYDDPAEQPRKYRHIIYRAHFEDVCKGTHAGNPDHRKDGEPWRPDGTGGCLLDPVRLDYKTLKTLMSHKAERFTVMYQQESMDPANVLVSPIWVSGGRGEDGVEYLGCWDANRGACELPKGLSGQLFSVATCDPSPTKFWAIEWWVYHPDSEQRFLMDLDRRAMEAPDFLDWDYNQGCFTGVMEDWQDRSERLGIPISHWVFEANAAQRFVLQFDHAKRWQRKRGVNVIPHQTARNKADDDFGVQTLAPHWQFGRVRLPGKQNNRGRMAAMKLVDEVTREWPRSTGTTDCLMAEWFFEYTLPSIYSPDVAPPRLHDGWANANRGLALVAS
jgi:hypothetical protein